MYINARNEFGFSFINSINSSLDIGYIMIREQLLLFPEYDDYKTQIRNVDYVDLTDIDVNLFDEKRKHPYKLLPKDKFYIFKTGGINKFRPDLGENFPYIKNMETGRVLSSSLSKTYIRSSITLPNRSPTITLEFRLHRTAAEAFIINDDIKKKLVVDHINHDRLDYRVSNLRWTTNSKNNIGTKRPRGMSYEEKKIASGIY
tara:strand:- start:437 stop:1042 length:606 start_codon:yes stop_codon:yes gene_type:complete